MSWMPWLSGPGFRWTRRAFDILVWRVEDWIRRHGRRLVHSLKKFQGLAIPAAATMVALGVDTALPPTIAPKTIGDLLVGTATLVGGFLTVAFALTVSLQQSVADLYSPQHLSEYSYERRQKTTFAAIAATVLGCLALGLYCQSLSSFSARTPRAAFVVSGFLALGIALALLEAQLRHGSERLRPTAAIAFLQHQAQRAIDYVDGEARRLARRMLLERPDVRQPTAIAWAYQQFQDTVNNVVVHHLSRLQEMSIRLADRGDAVAARQALDAWGDVLVVYLNRRQDSSSLRQSTTHVMVVESDSQWIFDRALEQLNDLGARFLKLSQIPSARAVVRVYERTTEAAAKVAYVNGSHENPILEQLGAYLDLYAKSASTHGDIDVPYATVDAFVSIGTKSIEAGLSHAPYGTCKHLDAVIALNARPDRSVVIEAAIMGYVRLVWAMLITPDAPRNFGPAVDSIERAHNTIGVLLALTPQNPTGPLWASSRLPFDRMRDVVRSLRDAIQNATDDDKLRYQRRFRDLADKLYSFVRRVAESTTSASAYQDLVPALIFDVVRLLLREGQDDPYSRTQEEATRWIWLLSWINHDERPIKRADAVLDAASTAARIVLYAIAEDGPPDIVLAAVQAQSGLTRALNDHQSSSYGYDEPRSMAPLTFAAALALKKKDLFSLHAIVAAIRAGSAAYATKYAGGNGPPTTVLREFLRDRDHFAEIRTPMATVVEPILGEAKRHLSLEDLDRTIWHIWNVVPKWSPLEEELAERRRLQTRLVAMLADFVERSRAATAVSAGNG